MTEYLDIGGTHKPHPLTQREQDQIHSATMDDAKCGWWWDRLTGNDATVAVMCMICAAFHRGDYAEAARLARAVVDEEVAKEIEG